MGPSKSTAAERQHMARLVELGCVVCRSLGQHDPTAHHPAITSPHHIVEGGKRKGHMFTIPLCHRHHQDHPHVPSRHPNKAAFEEAFGIEADLLRSTYTLLGYDPPEDVAQWIRVQRAMRAGV